MPLWRPKVVLPLPGDEPSRIGLMAGAGSAARCTLSLSPCHYGGRKWFFLCPVMNRRASVLWLPRGARHFASRHAWPGQVAYRSQFMTAMDRAYLGMARIKRRLIGD